MKLDWEFCAGWLGILFSLYLFWSWAFGMMQPIEEDFTDTGVGCVDDCLEPMDEPLPVMEV